MRRGVKLDHTIQLLERLFCQCILPLSNILIFKVEDQKSVPLPFTSSRVIDHPFGWTCNYTWILTFMDAEYSIWAPLLLCSRNASSYGHAFHYSLYPCDRKLWHQCVTCYNRYIRGEMKLECNKTQHHSSHDHCM